MPDNISHIVEDWWRPDQVELANDVSRVWDKKTFISQPGYSVPIDGGRMLTRLLPGEIIPEGAKLEPNAWDHEHCALCSNKIMEQGGDFEEGYTDGKEWLCPECYSQYIARTKS
jgi:hypothetical protein